MPIGAAEMPDVVVWVAWVVVMMTFLSEQVDEADAPSLGRGPRRGRHAPGRFAPPLRMTSRVVLESDHTVARLGLT
jgi:hypothetical protein